MLIFVIRIAITTDGRHQSSGSLALQSKKILFGDGTGRLIFGWGRSSIYSGLADLHWMLFLKSGKAAGRLAQGFLFAFQSCVMLRDLPVKTSVVQLFQYLSYIMILCLVLQSVPLFFLHRGSDRDCILNNPNKNVIEGPQRWKWKVLFKQTTEWCYHAV